MNEVVPLSTGRKDREGIEDLLLCPVFVVYTCLAFSQWMFKVVLGIKRVLCEHGLSCREKDVIKGSGLSLRTHEARS